MGLLDGKKGVILNIANDRSIAWHIANNVVKQGARCASTSCRWRRWTPGPYGDGGGIRHHAAVSLR